MSTVPQFLKMSKEKELDASPFPSCQNKLAAILEYLR